jgi:uncharacterized membrane protein YbhN (UPF0104 family)
VSVRAADAEPVPVEDLPAPGGGVSRTRRGRRRRVGVIALIVVVLGVELVVGAPAVGPALHHLRAPVWSWIGLAVLAEAASMGVFARMQRRLLAAAGTWVPLHRALALAYASHSLSVTLPGGPALSTAFNLAQMRRFGASPAAAAWTVALSGMLSSAALVLIGALGEVIGHGHHGLPAVAIDIVLAGAVAVIVRALVRHPNLLAGAVTRALRVVNRVLGRRVDRGRVQVVEIVEQLCTMRLPGRDLLIVAGFAVGNWLLDAACFWLSALAVGADIRSLADGAGRLYRGDGGREHPADSRRPGRGRRRSGAGSDRLRHSRRRRDRHYHRVPADQLRSGDRHRVGLLAADHTHSRDLKALTAPFRSPPDSESQRRGSQ